MVEAEPAGAIAHPPLDEEHSTHLDAEAVERIVAALESQDDVEV